MSCAITAAMSGYDQPRRALPPSNSQTLTTTGKVERWHQSLQAEFLDDAGPFASIADAQAAVDKWREEYNQPRPHQALDMACPADRFRPSPVDGDTLTQWAPADLVPVASPAGGGEIVPAAAEPAGWADAVEIERVVPPSGNMTVGPQQFWLGASRTGQQVRFWIDTTTAHLSIAGWRIKTVPSRLTAADLARLRGAGARPAGPPPARASTRSPRGDQLRGGRAAGQRCRDHHPRRPGHPGRLPAGRAARPDPPGRPGHARHYPRRRLVAQPALPIPPGQRHKLQGVRLAGPQPLPPASLVIQRKVSSRGGIQVACQRIQVGFGHAGQTVTIQPGDTTLRITDQHGDLITTVPRAANGEITRVKAYRTRARQPG